MREIGFLNIEVAQSRSIQNSGVSCSRDAPRSQQIARIGDQERRVVVGVRHC